MKIWSEEIYMPKRKFRFMYYGIELLKIIEYKKQNGIWRKIK